MTDIEYSVNISTHILLTHTHTPHTPHTHTHHTHHTHSTLHTLHCRIRRTLLHMS